MVSAASSATQSFLDIPCPSPCLVVRLSPGLKARSDRVKEAGVENAPRFGSEAEANVREVPEAARAPERDEHGEDRSADERQRPARVVGVVNEEDLDRDDPVDERARDRVDQDARVRRPEAEDEDAVEGDRQRAEDREP